MARSIIYKSFLAFVTCIHGLYGQSNYLLDYFKAYRTDNQIILIWQLGKGNQCAGLAIHRSINDQSFEKIGEIQGICGSDTSAQFYSFADEHPIPGKTHRYMLELGFYGNTEPPVELFFPDFSGNLSQVIPNPLAEKGRIIFSNPRNEEHRLTLYESSGRLLGSQTTNEDYFLIHADDFWQKTGNSTVFGGQIFYRIHLTSNRSEISKGKITMIKTNE